jgi:hypothetical protein
VQVKRGVLGAWQGQRDEQVWAVLMESNTPCWRSPGSCWHAGQTRRVNVSVAQRTSWSPRSGMQAENMVSG